MSKIIITQGHRKRLWWWEVRQAGYEPRVSSASSQKRAERDARKLVQNRLLSEKRRAKPIIIDLPDFEDTL